MSVGIGDADKLGGTVPISSSTTTGTVDTKSYTTSVTRSATGSPTIPPLTAFGETF